MEKRFIEISGIRLAYIEKNKDARNTVFFIHGNSGSSSTWNKQLSSNLLNRYKLIAIDLPGHGHSAASNNPLKDYNPVATGEIIAMAIKKLANGNPYALVGFSYGTNIIGEALYHDLKPVGIVLSASCIIGGDYGMDKAFMPPVTTIFFQDENTEEDVKSYFLTALVSNEDAKIYIQDFLAVKLPFRSSLLQNVIAGKFSNEIDIIGKQEIPVLVFFGLEDNLLNIHYLDNAPVNCWKNKIHKLANAGHFVQTDQATIFNELLAEYLSECFKAIHA